MIFSAALFCNWSCSFGAEVTSRATRRDQVSYRDTVRRNPPEYDIGYFGFVDHLPNAVKNVKGNIPWGEVNLAGKPKSLGLSQSASRLGTALSSQLHATRVGTADTMQSMRGSQRGSLWATATSGFGRPGTGGTFVRCRKPNLRVRLKQNTTKMQWQGSFGNNLNFSGHFL